MIAIETSLFFMAVSLLVLGVVGIMRALFLLSEARRDQEELRGHPPQITTMATFFVRANYIHMIKFGCAFALSVLLVLVAVESPIASEEVKTALFAVVLVSVFLLAVTLLELEVRARRKVKLISRDQRHREKREGR